MSAENRNRSLALAAVGILVLGLAITVGIALGHPQQQRPEGFPDLVSGLKGVPGCLGVETARTASGKNVIFAWFEDKQAVLRWYYSDMHQHAMKMLLGDGKPDPPLQGVPDDVGPVLVIASITMSDKPQIEGVSDAHLANLDRAVQTHYWRNFPWEPIRPCDSQRARDEGLHAEERK